MDYEQLTPAYRQKQTQRLSEALARISARSQAAVAGRVVPGDTDLALGTGRRLQMAVLFIDLCGFSGRPAENAKEQEVLLQVFDFFFTEMIRIAEDYGGTVEKNTGDGLMAYFEDTSAESGAKRAVACALTMMDTTERLINPVLQKSSLQKIEFRVGIDHGIVTVAKLGAAKRFGSLVAIGTTANVASKMLDVAEAGDILIGANTQHRLPDDWKQWCHVLTESTGWVYRWTGQPYPFYRFTGRWTYSA